MSQPVNNAQYPPVQVTMTTERETNEVEQMQKQDQQANDSLMRLRGGGCVKGCLEAICCCCALEAICCCEIDEICC